MAPTSLNVRFQHPGSDTLHSYPQKRVKPGLRIGFPRVTSFRAINVKEKVVLLQARIMSQKKNTGTGGVLSEMSFMLGSK